MQGTSTPQSTDVERAGSFALSVFARVLNARVLRAHADGPLSSRELERRFGWAPKASLRLAAGNLRDLGAIAAVESVGARGGTVTELTTAGQELLAVAEALERWLLHSPFGPIDLPDTPARGVVRALTAGWDSAVVRALAERPRTLAELSADIPQHSYPALKRRLAKLRSANLVTPVNGRGRSPAHAATQWLRCAVGPLSAAGRWEQNHADARAEPMTRLEMEAALLLALPLVELPRDVSGRCVLAALTADGEAQNGGPTLAAVNFEVEGGRVVSSVVGTNSKPTTWALGTPEAWLDAMIEGRSDALRLRGTDAKLAVEVVKGIHQKLFPK